MWGKNWLGTGRRDGALVCWPQIGQVLYPALGGGIFLLLLLNFSCLAQGFGQFWWTLWCHTTVLVQLAARSDFKTFTSKN